MSNINLNKSKLSPLQAIQQLQSLGVNARGILVSAAIQLDKKGADYKEIAEKVAEIAMLLETALQAELNVFNVPFNDDPNVSYIGRVNFEDDGSGGHFQNIYQVKATSKEEAINAVKPHLHVDGDYCKHSHDCCGHYYPRPIEVERYDSKSWIVKQSFHQNV